MKRFALVATVLLVAAALAPATAGAQQASAYSGTHVEFTAESNAVTDYTVDGKTYFESVKVQSESNAESSGGIGLDAGLSAVTSLSGSALTLDSQTTASASVTAESGATMTAHDNEHGIVVVESGDEAQYVQANVSSDSEATAESDSKVVVTRGDGSQAAVMVVGDGSVTVNDEGDVTAKVGSDGTLVVRTYDEERNSDDKSQEQFIQNGTATAEVYVMQQGEETVTDTVNYGQDTTVEVTQQSENSVEMAVDRSTEQGTVVLTSISSAVESADDVSVTVDGAAAAQASSYTELESAANGGDSSKYMVTSTGSASASTDVAVAVNHFSERTVGVQNSQSDDSTVTTTEESSTTSESTTTDTTERTDSTDGTTSSATSPGFGVGVALVSLLAAAVALARRE